MPADAPKSAVQLPPALHEVLGGITDQDFRGRLRDVFEAAARVIAHLRNFELIRYESKSAEGGADLELLEEIAPVLMATVTEINLLVAAVEGGYPDGWKSKSKDPLEVERVARCITILRERTQGFRADVLALGAQLRTPQAVADRWNLLGSLQSSRGKLRFGIGEMVTDVANVFTELPRSKVVPEYELDTEHALLLRRTLAKLTAGIRAHNARLQSAAPADVPKMLAKLNDLLERLAKTQTWFELRAPDKREFIRFREQVTVLAGQGSPQAETRIAVEGFARFLELLCAIVSQRDILRSHDRACLAELTTRLEQAEMQLGAQPEEAKAGINEALELCDRMAGRDEVLDDYLAKLRAQASRPPEQCIQALREHTLRLLGAI